MTGIWPWEWFDTAAQTAQDTVHGTEMIVLGALLGLAAIVILVKGPGKFKVPGFIICMAGAVLVLGGFV
jgi:hypothetical protein